jgi:hypothetical protein
MRRLERKRRKRDIGREKRREEGERRRRIMEE